MLNLLTEYWLELVFGLIAAGALSFCKYTWGKMREYKQLIDKTNDEHLIVVIDQRIQPIKQELQDLSDMLADAIDDEQNLKHNLLSSYRFRLMQLCKIYIRQQYITQDQYDQLSEFFKIYELLGGNGQAKEYYERAIELPIVETIPLVGRK